MHFLDSMPYRKKLIFTNTLIVLLVVTIVVPLTTVVGTRQAISSSETNLSLLTDQSVINVIAKAQYINQQLYSAGDYAGVAERMMVLRSLPRDSTEYAQTRQTLQMDLGKMLGTSALYDVVTVRLENADCISASLNYRTKEDPYLAMAEKMICENENARKQYGRMLWNRGEDGELYMIRDLYNTHPLKYVGRMAAHIQQDALLKLGPENARAQYTMLIYDQRGKLVSVFGEDAKSDRWNKLRLANITGSRLQIDDKTYFSCQRSEDGWTVVGLQPVSVATSSAYVIMFSGIAAIILSMTAALFLSFTISSQLTRQIKDLTDSMNQMARGDMNVSLTVRGSDEINMLTKRFNEMTVEMQALMDRVVQEEKIKQQAEYMNLEYQYRFLQWQINPHFIYNALETINAIGKIDGNEEVCEMIQLLSGYFRHNAETMRKRFVTVHQEIRSLRLYVAIYRKIYGQSLQIDYRYDDDAGSAYLPTMIIQPLLENALIHGISSEHESQIDIQALVEDERLIVHIQDNGPGMSEETISSILNCHNENPTDKEERTSLGVRNVLDRLHLLFGDEAGLSIRSLPEAGTCVTINMPVNYTLPSDNYLQQ